MGQTDILIQRYPCLTVCKKDILTAYQLLEKCFSEGNTLYIAGNGGSRADAEHIVGELMKSFKMKRPCGNDFARRLRETDPECGAVLADKLQKGLPAVVLGNESTLNTAFLNDVDRGGELLYAQHLFGYGKKGGVFLGISTSGNAKNVIYAAIVARAMGMKVIALTGKNGGGLARFADVAIKVPEEETYMIQELHLPVYHCLCLMLEEHFFSD